MKRVFLFAIVISLAQARAQSVAPIKPLALGLSEVKTSTCVFKYDILHVDMGSSSIAAQVVPGAPTVLEVKATKGDFLPTTLTVVTAEPRVYIFNVFYENAPSNLGLIIDPFPAGNDNSSSKRVTLRETDSIKALIQHDTTIWMSHKMHGFRVRVELNGIYSVSNLLFFRLHVVNLSPIEYLSEDVKASLVDQEAGKKLAVQTIPITQFGPAVSCAIPAGGDTTIVLSFPAFSVPKKKRLKIDLIERSGGRTLSLLLRPRVMLKVRQWK